MVRGYIGGVGDKEGGGSLCGKGCIEVERETKREGVVYVVSMGVREGAYGAYAYPPGRRTKNGVGLIMLW